jgi:hypothetical protein
MNISQADEKQYDAKRGNDDYVQEKWQGIALIYCPMENIDAICQWKQV